MKDADVKSEGVLAIWHDVVPEREAAVLHWYNREHHPERLSVPGFLTARRHRAIEGDPALFIAYEVATTDVLASGPYLERVNNPTDWTQSMMPNFRNNSRTVCNVLRREGGGSGGYSATFRLSGKAAGDGGARAVAACIAGFMASEGSVSAEIWEADLGRTTINSDERRLRGAVDQVVERVLMLSASDPAPLKSAILVMNNCPDRVEAGLYQLEYMGISHTAG